MEERETQHTHTYLHGLGEESRPNCRLLVLVKFITHEAHHEA